jgi:hypothetical protein
MKYKQFIAGILVGIILSIGTVFADTQAIEVFFNNIKVSLNGEVLELNDATGNPVQPFIYAGSTYLPVRAVSEALGMEVKFNETTNTVELTQIINLEENTTEMGVGDVSLSETIEYDLNTKLPIGAEIVEYKGSKDAVRYGGNIYLSISDLSHKFGIKYVHMDVKAHTETFIKDAATVVIDTKATGNRFLNSVGRAYYNAELFSELIGE